VTLRTKAITIIIIIALATYAIVSIFVIWRLTIPISEPQPEIRREITELYQRIADLEYMLENTDDPEVIRQIAEELLGLIPPD